MLPARSSFSRKAHVMPSSVATAAAVAQQPPSATATGGSGGSAATRDSSRSPFLSHVAVGLSGGRKRPDTDDDARGGATSGSHLAA